MYNMWQLNTKMLNGMCMAHEDGIFCGYCERCKYIWKAQSTESWGIKSHDVWAMENYKNGLENLARAKIERRKLKQEIDRKIEGKIEHELWTIALPEEFEVGKLREKIEEIIDDGKFGFKQSAGVIEFHSSEYPDGGNLHIHILTMMDKTYKPSRRIKDLAKYFGIENNFVDRQKGYLEEDFKNRLNYIYGRKISDDKKVYVGKDRIWREDNLLPHVTTKLPNEIERLYLRGGVGGEGENES